MPKHFVPVLVLAAALSACGGAEPQPDASTDAAPSDATTDTSVRPDGGTGPDSGCVDADGDGHPSVACGGDDCDDADPMRYPGNAEVCDAAGHDEDCDPATFGSRDADGDGYVDMACCNTGSSGPVCGDDCNDADANVHPTAPEVCNGIDDDCNGMVDEGVTGTFYADCDADGYGGAESVVRCTAPTTSPTSCPGALWTGVGGDCDDTRAATHPAAAELCNGIDDNCDGTVDEGGDAACAAALPHTAAATCTAGTCAVTTCAGAFLDCDAAAPGCEVDGGRDAQNCHTCGNLCAFSCSASACDDAVEVEAGTGFTCARRASGTVLCWGDNGTGQLGDGTTTMRTVPTLVPGITDAVELAAGGAHACVRHAGGTVSCWGNNDDGQVGDGTFGVTRLVPTPVVGITNAVEIDAGGLHTCARLATGSVMCWGFGGVGVLGVGTTATHTSPVAVTGLTDAIAVATGRTQTCAVHAGGGVSCWGDNAHGELGDGTTTNRTLPTTVTGVTGAIDVIAGTDFSCALLGGGAGVSCWGTNFRGQLGDTTTTERHSATTTVGSGGTLSISTAAVSVLDGHVCATTGGGGAHCWGANTHGQLGDGSTTEIHDASATSILLGVDQITGGDEHSCALAFGGLSCWGSNATGQLGDGTTTDRHGPTGVAAP